MMTPTIPAGEAVAVEAPPVNPPKRSSGRWKPLRFALVFGLLVLSMLLGYRYAVNTQANLWYLFQVANHTSWVLDITGEFSEVEREHPMVPPHLAREQLAQWRGANTAVAASEDDEAAEDAPPLTPWERWQYRAHAFLSEGNRIVDFGPKVFFVANYGTATEIRTLHEAIYETEQDKTLEPEEKLAKMDALKAELETLREADQALPSGQEGFRKRVDKAFTFFVVPSCGAIEVMAIFIAAVIAFPTRWRFRLAGLAVGVPILYGVNIARLSTLAWIGAYDFTPEQKWFHFSHEYVWQGIFIIFVVAVWLAWIELFVPRKRA